MQIKIKLFHNLLFSLLLMLGFWFPSLQIASIWVNKTYLVVIRMGNVMGHSQSAVINNILLICLFLCRSGKDHQKCEPVIVNLPDTFLHQQQWSGANGTPLLGFPHVQIVWRTWIVEEEEQKPVWHRWTGCVPLLTGPSSVPFLAWPDSMISSASGLALGFFQRSTRWDGCLMTISYFDFSS